MPVLGNIKHEQFALLVVKGLSATKAYVSAGYSPKGAQQSAARMLTNSKVRESASCRRPSLQEQSPSKSPAATPGSRRCNTAGTACAPVSICSSTSGRGHGRSPRLRSGLLCRDYNGKEADRLVTRIDPGVVSLLAELRGHERQAAEELERWKTHHEERKVVDASPAAVTLALLLTDEELDSLEKRAGDGEIAGRGRKGGSDVASPQPAARHGEPAQVFPANAAAADGRPRLDGVIGWSRICAMAGGAADGRPSLSRFSPMEPGSDPRPAGRGHGRCARRRQRVAGARLQG